MGLFRPVAGQLYFYFLYDVTIKAVERFATYIVRAEVKIAQI
jgi:hypothetical protein